MALLALTFLPFFHPHFHFTPSTKTGQAQSQQGPNCGGFRDEKTKNRHDNKHAIKQNEFDPPFASADDYEYAGRSYMSGSTPPEGTLQGNLTSEGIFNGDMVRYTPATNEFGIKAVNNFLRTYYKPINGIQEFWETIGNGFVELFWDGRDNSCGL
jgi:hypothetical protein